jgi:hypothetical protein
VDFLHSLLPSPYQKKKKKSEMIIFKKHVRHRRKSCSWNCFRDVRLVESKVVKNWRDVEDSRVASASYCLPSANGPAQLFTHSWITASFLKKKKIVDKIHTCHPLYPPAEVAHNSPYLIVGDHFVPFLKNTKTTTLISRYKFLGITPSTGQTYSV